MIRLSVAEGSEAKGIYRDPVRSSDSHLVTSGLRWLSLMLLVPIPWAQRVWALPFLTVLAPSTNSRKSSTQAADGLGQTNDKASAMVAEANDGCGCR